MVRFTEDLSGCYTHKQEGDIILHPINDDPYNVAVAYLNALKERGEFDEDDMNCKELLICLHSFYYGGFRTAMECALYLEQQPIAVEVPLGDPVVE